MLTLIRIAVCAGLAYWCLTLYIAARTFADIIIALYPDISNEELKLQMRKTVRKLFRLER